MTDLTRRRFLKTGAAAAGLGLMGTQAFTTVLHADEPEMRAGRLVAFPLHAVRLSPGIFKQQASGSKWHADNR